MLRTKKRFFLLFVIVGLIATLASCASSNKYVKITLDIFIKFRRDIMKTVISVIGKDTVGIISKVSAICAECNANINDITQSVLGDMFVMVMLTEITDLNCSFGDFKNCMTELGKNLGLDIHVMHQDVFNSMHRI